MVNQQMLEGNWNEIKGKIRTHWGQLTDDDLSQFHVEVDKLVGTIQRKTGEGRDVIERYLNDLSGPAASTLGQAAESVRQYSQRAAETVQNTAQQAAGQVAPATSRPNASSATGQASRSPYASVWD